MGSTCSVYTVMMNFKKALKILMSILAILVMAVLLYGIFIEPYKVVVKDVYLELPAWKKAPDLNIAVISDLHIGWPFTTLERLDRIVSLVNAQNPDIILNLGDYDTTRILGTSVDQEKMVDILDKLEAPLGTYSILGNHDGLFTYKMPFQTLPTKEEQRALLEKLLKKADIRLLDNQALLLEKDGKRFGLVGLTDDISTEWPFIKFILHNKKPEPQSYPNLTSTVRMIPLNYPVILMNHTPDIFPEVPERVALTLSGHTHGGQIKIPFVQNLTIPSMYGNKYANGLIKEEDKHLYVSSGLGTSLVLPMRLGFPPEIVIIHLRSQD